MPESSIPAFLTIAGIPLTFSIAAGIGLGVLSYVLVMVATGKARGVHPLMWAIAPFFVAFFAADWLERARVLRPVRCRAGAAGRAGRRR